MRKKVELVKTDTVKVPSLFGIKPGKWLTWLYLFIIILAIFLVCFLPGIINGQKRVTFTSANTNAAVYLDGLYLGGTPFTQAVKSGIHDVEFKVNGVSIEKAKMEVGHPVFLTWCFPRKMTFEGKNTIQVEHLKSLYTTFLNDVEDQSAVLLYDQVHNYKPVFTSFAKTVESLKAQLDKKVLDLALSHISTKEMLEDAINACTILDYKYDFSLAKALFADENSSLAKSFIDNQEVVISTIKTSSTDSLTYKDFTMGGVKVSTGDFTMGEVGSFSYTDSICAIVPKSNEKEFVMGTKEISEYQWALFLSENPYWSASNKDNLIKEGKVDSAYMAGITPSVAFISNRPIRNISYYAAQAFCAWLSEKTGKNVFLPTEEQWTAAYSTLDNPLYQKSLISTDTKSAISSMGGGVWEMTDSAFVPLKRAQEVLKVDTSYTEALSTYSVQSDMIIKGGSYLSVESPQSVGIISRIECFEALGFRIAWN